MCQLFTTTIAESQRDGEREREREECLEMEGLRPSFSVPCLKKGGYNGTIPICNSKFSTLKPHISSHLI